MWAISALVYLQVIFLIALVIYSAFLLTNLKGNDEMGGYEIFVYIWMVTDMYEEYVVRVSRKFF